MCGVAASVEDLRVLLAGRRRDVTGTLRYEKVGGMAATASSQACQPATCLHNTTRKCVPLCITVPVRRILPIE
ncbi:hypothetical protein E2C01_049644 [Portunus trituberculatus]|uniref:Uncharacterized protein n=1 Tax=Portunus trituberculatus TaxID=210409 RepID=A0A5B7GDN7_PORTR|nr:hypothetical protein [Portunus trituberculatus]